VKIILDLNVLLDVVQRREPHFAASANVVAQAVRAEIVAVVASHCLTTLYYIIAKHADTSTADHFIDWTLSKLTIQSIEQDGFLRARAIAMNDFEDAVVAATAEAAQCDYIVTRNINDFKNSPITALTPEEFLAL